MPESFTKGQQIAQLQGQKLTCFGPQHGFKRFGQSGQLSLRAVPAHRRRRRRHLHRPIDADRADQPRSGAHVHEQRLDHHRPAERRVVGAVRAGRGDGEPARLRRARLRRARAARCSRSRRVSGRPASCRASSRACGSTRSAMRCPISRTRPASAAAMQQRLDRRDQCAEPAAATAPFTTRKSRRASRSTRWRSRCRRACRS